MTELLTAAGMRALEGAAIESGRVSGLELMERAGRGVVEAALEKWPALATAPHRAVVLCGPGNNGGDGFVVARLLKERGWEVEVLLYGDEAKLPPDAAANARRWREIGGDVAPYADECFRPSPEGRRSGCLIVDALFGTGLTRPVEGVAELRRATQRRGAVRGGSVTAAPASRQAPVVAVDVPSGLCADSGKHLRPDAGERGEPMRADLTVTFHRRKLGHVLAEGPRACGEVRVVDIGLGKPRVRGVAREVRGPLQDLAKAGARHKYDHGHALVLAGGPGTGGAGRLAARGALRVGAGAVTVGVPPAAIPENAARLDAIMLRPVEDLGAFLEGPGAKMNAVCLGPGHGGGAPTRAAVAAACGSGRAVVLDADALTSFEDEPGALFALLHERCVITPHLGEFGRVFPDLHARLAEPAERGPAFSKVDAAREAAARAGAVVLLKGADTVIAHPDGRASVSAAVYERAAPWLATAGAGDVLAGFVAGLLARGFAPVRAAGTAAWLHVECARRFGPGLIAEDLPEQVPGVFRQLGL
ncbi:MAG TPA: NAD(P)H-hydrate dehydratase [Thermohalobaculum sp.]|nr:NAD(P)H-hydrate dehydratase [Thermohalobaculum sp.]